MAKRFIWGAFIAAAFAASSASAQLVINEVEYDTPGTDTAEFIELYNRGSGAVNLADYAIVLVNGATNSAYRTITPGAFTVPPGGYFVICGNTNQVVPCNYQVSPATDFIQNGSPDGVALIHIPTSTLADAISYEGPITQAATLYGTFNLVEGTRTLAMDDGGGLRTIGRVPDGVDTDEAWSDWQVCEATPGGPNNGQCLPPHGVVAPGSQDVCVGAVVTMTATTTGTGPLTYTWRFGRTSLEDDGRITGSRSSQVTLNGVLPTDAGSYVCFATNWCGLHEMVAVTLTVASACCNPDYNQDGGGDTSDVLDLANDIASGTNSFPGSSSDFNQDGGSDTSDVIALADTIAGAPCP